MFPPRRAPHPRPRSPNRSLAPPLHFGIILSPILLPGDRSASGRPQRWDCWLLSWELRAGLSTLGRTRVFSLRRWKSSWVRSIGHGHRSVPRAQSLGILRGQRRVAREIRLLKTAPSTILLALQRAPTRERLARPTTQQGRRRSRFPGTPVLLSRNHRSPPQVNLQAGSR